MVASNVSGSLLRRSCGNACQQAYQAFSRRGMSKDCIAERGVWQARQHCGLNRCHRLAGFDAEYRDSENAIAVLIDQHLQKAARFR